MNDVYSTNSLYLAAFLKCRGVVLISIERARGNSKALFVFRDSPERQELCDSFLFGRSDEVHAKEYMQTLRNLKSVLYDG